MEAIASKLVLQAFGMPGGKSGFVGFIVVVGLAGGPIGGRLVSGCSGYSDVGNVKIGAHLFECLEPYYRHNNFK
jgi:hypothetical protein